MFFLVPVWTRILKCMIKRCIKKYRTIPQKNLFLKSQLCFNKLYSSCANTDLSQKFQQGMRCSGKTWSHKPTGLQDPVPESSWEFRGSELGLSAPVSPPSCSVGYPEPSPGPPWPQGWRLDASHHCQQCWSQSRTRVKHHQTTAKCPQCLGQSPLLGFPVTKLWISY